MRHWASRLPNRAGPTDRLPNERPGLANVASCKARLRSVGAWSPVVAPTDPDCCCP